MYVQLMFQGLTVVLLVTMLYCTLMMAFHPWSLDHQLPFRSAVSETGFLVSYILNIISVSVSLLIFRVSNRHVCHL